MSWSITVSPKPLEAALKDLDAAAEQAKAQSPHSEDQIDYAIDVVNDILTEGMFGTEHQHDYALSLVGHTNADHSPVESLNINISTHARAQAT